MKLVLRIFVSIILFPLFAIAQPPCVITIHGKVFDRETGQPMPFATVILPEVKNGTTCDANGQFTIKSLCPGTYTFECSFVGYKTIREQIALSESTMHDFSLASETTAIKEIVVQGEIENDRALVSQSKTELKGEDLVRVRGLTLGESLNGITGVYTLQSGPSIFKPVIHGLHSNRILIFNNGVRQEGQQWGSEHAPEIDPFIATKVTVVKGASSVQYGSDAIGGVILVEPAALPATPGVSGEVNLMGASNGRLGVTSGIVQGAFNKKLSGLQWRAQGTYRRAGNALTPDYYLDNTGYSEGNFSAALGYRKQNFGGELYYSEFNTRLGIFSGTHAESISDIEAAIQRPRPLTPSYFNYTIDRPYQQVKHDLFKANGFYIFNNRSRLDIVFARQQNLRSEYDYVPLTGNLNPELYLRLVTHTADVVYKHKAVNKYSGSFGFNGITQGNVRQYQMLIPNFRNYGGGVFYIGKWTSERLTLEGGVRYDYRWLRAYTLDNNTAQVITPTWNFQNFTETIGSNYRINSHFSWTFSIGTAWRAPTVNELLSQGVHQSAVAYEIGNPDLHTERAYNITTSLYYESERLHGELGLYNNVIDGYIFLKPDLQFIHTIRGAYPTFTYTQVDARFRGIDLNLTYNIIDPLSITTKVSTLYAWNKTIHDYLQLIPANRFEAIARYDFGNLAILKKSYCSIGGIYVAKQNRVPGNSDYADPPPGYTLLNANIGFSLLTGKQRMHVTFTANNITNTAYRDYMDRFRYFMLEPGRNLALRLQILF